MPGMMSFNIGDGYIEAILRGYRMSLLTSSQYSNLTQCETIDDLKGQLCSSTDYYDVLHSEPSPLSTSILSERLKDQFVNEFRYLKNNCSESLRRFLDYITYGYMIDNVVLLIAGALKGEDRSGMEGDDDIMERCHPLGVFDSMAALLVATSVDEIYNIVLVESPLAPYFRGCFSADDLDELHIELIRNHLWKAYLEDFYGYVCISEDLDEVTKRLMKEMLSFEADRRVINIAVNACGSERLSKEDRVRLFPRFGNLYEGGLSGKLARVDDLDQVRGILEPFVQYRSLLSDQQNDGFGMKSTTSTSSYYPNESTSKKATSTELIEPRSMEEIFFDLEMSLCRETFEYQFTFAPFYAWTKMKEQEIRNVVWIAECIGQGQRQNIHNYIPVL